MQHYTAKNAIFSILAALAGTAAVAEDIKDVGDEVIAAHRAALAANTDGQGFGPQAPRDLTSSSGENSRSI